MEKITEDHYIPEPNTGCYIWLGAVNSSGYGHLVDSNGHILAHRKAYEQKYGPIPKGLQGRHYKCGTKLCVNEAHIKPGTQSDNEQDKKKHGRANYYRQTAEGREATRQQGYANWKHGRYAKPR